MDSDFNGVGERIHHLMKLNNIKQIDVCKKTGLCKNTISNYVNGNRLPDTEALYKLSKLFNVSMEWLLTGNDTLEYSGLLGEDKIILFKKENVHKIFSQLTMESVKEILSFIKFKHYEQSEQSNKDIFLFSTIK